MTLGRILAGLALISIGAAGGIWVHASWDSRAPETPVVAQAAPASAAPTTGPAAAPTAAPGGPNFTYRYLAPESPELAAVYQRVRERDLLRQLPEVQWLDGLLALPAPIAYVTAECGQPDAYYLPGERKVVLCYEMLQVLYEQGAQLAASGSDIIDAVDTSADAARTPGVAERYVWANVRFIVSHETGHALIDLLDLPVTGREEDAVDQFATALMQGIADEDESPRQVAENLRLAGHWFLARAETEFSLDAYADTHAFGLQRYFNLQCLLYGSDPERFADIVARGDLPESRARYCPVEAERATSAWLRLLLPHLAPKYRMTLDEAEDWLEQRRRARPADPLGGSPPAGNSLPEGDSPPVGGASAPTRSFRKPASAPSGRG